MKAPCKDCKKRTLGCHSKCRAYSCYQIDIRSVREKRKEEVMTRTYICDESYKNWKNKQGLKKKVKYDW